MSAKSADPGLGIRLSEEAAASGRAVINARHEVRLVGLWILAALLLWAVSAHMLQPRPVGADARILTRGGLLAQGAVVGDGFLGRPELTDAPFRMEWAAGELSATAVVTSQPPGLLPRH